MIAFKKVVHYTGTQLHSMVDIKSIKFPLSNWDENFIYCQLKQRLSLTCMKRLTYLGRPLPQSLPSTPETWDRGFKGKGRVCRYQRSWN